MNALRLLKWIFAFLLITGYASQCILVNQHLVEHFGEKHYTAQSSRPAITQNCPLCALAQTVPRTTKTITAIPVVFAVTAAPPLPPIFNSENAVLLPFGARAPPRIA